MCSTDCLLVFIALLFPPLPVWVKRGLCSADSVINIALCMLGFIPGLIHSWYIITSTPDEHERYEYQRIAGSTDLERGSARGASVYYNQMPGQHLGGQPQHRPQIQPQSGYGTLNQEQASGSNDTVPPSYDEAVQGDHKIQTR